MDRMEILATVITVVFIPLATWLITTLTEFIKTKSENAKLEKYLDIANDAICTAVAEVMQTYVSAIKNSGEWNEETAEKAKEMAKLKAIEIMGATTYRAMPKIVDDLQSWIYSKIEAAIFEMKIKEGAK